MNTNQGKQKQGKQKQSNASNVQSSDASANPSQFKPSWWKDDVHGKAWDASKQGVTSSWKATQGDLQGNENAAKRMKTGGSDRELNRDLDRTANGDNIGNIRDDGLDLTTTARADLDRSSSRNTARSLDREQSLDSNVGRTNDRSLSRDRDQDLNSKQDSDLGSTQDRNFGRDRDLDLSGKEDRNLSVNRDRRDNLNLGSAGSQSSPDFNAKSPIDSSSRPLTDDIRDDSDRLARQDRDRNNRETRASDRDLRSDSASLDDDQPLRYGVGARREFGSTYPNWNPQLEKKLRDEWMSSPDQTGRRWDEVQRQVKHGYDFSQDRGSSINKPSGKA